MKTNLLISLFFVLFSFGWASPSMAANPCSPDQEKFCKDVKIGANRLNQCFNVNAAKLSVECKAFRESLKERLSKTKEPCQDDFVEYCSDKEAGRGEIRKCLVQHRNKISNACKAEMNAQRQLKRAKKQQQKRQQANAKKAKNG